jgi:hypothetical protein
MMHACPSILFLLSNNAPTRARTLQPINCLMYLPNRKTIHMTKSHLHPRVCSLELTPARSVMHPAKRKKNKPNKPETQETSSKTLYHKDNKNKNTNAKEFFPSFRSHDPRKPRIFPRPKVVFFDCNRSKNDKKRNDASHGSVAGDHQTRAAVDGEAGEQTSKGEPGVPVFCDFLFPSNRVSGEAF